MYVPTILQGFQGGIGSSCSKWIPIQGIGLCGVRVFRAASPRGAENIVAANCQLAGSYTANKLADSLVISPFSEKRGSWRPLFHTQGQGYKLKLTIP